MITQEELKNLRLGVRHLSKDKIKKDNKEKEIKKEELEKKKKEVEKKAPQPKKKTTPVKKAVIDPMVHIEDFLFYAKPEYELHPMQVEGFKAYMVGKHYLPNFDEFTHYLDQYLN